MGCAQSHDQSGAVRRNSNDASRISPLALVVATSPWMPQPGASVNVNSAVTFLKMRGVYALDTVQQVRVFGFLRNPSLAPKALIPYYTQCRATLMSLFKLVVDGETREVTPPNGYNLRLDDFPGFSLPAPYAIDAIVQRVQESKRCAPNAVALVQVGSINRELLIAGLPPTHTMTDVAEYWKRYASVSRLTNQVFGLAEAEDSIALLESFLQPGSVVASADLDQCERKLAEFGFGLVSHFRVFTDLFEAGPEVIHFAGNPLGDCVHSPQHEGNSQAPSFRLHAMVLLSVFTDRYGMRHFLIQNTWRTKQFFEVDETYLKGCRATISFIETPQTGKPGFPCSSGFRWVEAESGDCSDVHIGENM